MIDPLSSLIGKTPMIKINYTYKNQPACLYAKLEYYNLTGSIKDRIALHIIRRAYADGSLRPGQRIIEATSGNTGISFAAIGSMLGHPIHIFMPAWMSKERQLLMQSYGATLSLVSREDGGFQRCIREADALAQTSGGFRPNQFSNTDNLDAHYATTGQEILDQIGSAAALISGIGTGGTLMGTGKRLREACGCKLIAVEPDSLPILTKGITVGAHKIEGIGDDFIPKIVDTNQLDDVIAIRDDDAINMARRLSRELGLGVGISSGANFLGAVLAGEKNPGKIVTVFADDNKKYLSTDLGKPVVDDPAFVSNQLTLGDIADVRQ